MAIPNSNTETNKRKLKVFWLLTALVIAGSTCPFYALVYAPGIDGSLPWVFNFFAGGHFSLGQHTLFPHGPLDFLLYPLCQGRNLFVAVTVHVFFATLFVLCCFQLSAFKPSKHPWLTPVLAFVFLCFADLQLQLIALTVCLLWLFVRTSVVHFLVAATLVAVLNLFIKTYGGVICLLLLVGAVFIKSVQQREAKPALVLLTGLLIFLSSGWLLLYGNFQHFFAYLFGQFQLSADNSEAVQFDRPVNWFLLLPALMALAAFFVACWQNKERRFFFILLLPLFAAWKHAMARNEEVHMTGFLAFLGMLAILIAVLHELRLALLPALAAAIYFFAIPFNDDRTMGMRVGNLVRFANAYNYVFKADSIGKLHQAHSDYYCRNLHLPDSTKQLLGTNTVDIYPWNYAIAATNHLNWQPRPVINSYACYTSWLDAQNAQHWDSEKAPQFVLWELTDFDERGLKLESIDSRYVLNDEPNALLRFFANYNPVYKTGNLMLYKKRDKAISFRRKEGQIQTATFDTWLDVPETKPNQIVRVKFTTAKTVLGKLKSAFYKGELFYVHYLLNNSEEIAHRIVPKNAADGVWLNPLVLRPGEGPAPRIKRIRFSCNNRLFQQKEFSYSFELLDVLPDSTEQAGGLLFAD